MALRAECGPSARSLETLLQGIDIGHAQDIMYFPINGFESHDTGQSQVSMVEWINLFCGVLLLMSFSIFCEEYEVAQL